MSNKDRASTWRWMDNQPNDHNKREGETMKNTHMPSEVWHAKR
jgi:hypothetical protein